MRDAHCCDCSIGTIAIDEWYMVNNEVWEQAWSGRRRSQYVIPGSGGLIDEFLCIGCLEKRIGRTLCRTDFIDAPINRFLNNSDRLLDRLTADVSHLLVARRPA
jgi:hypothetical protein